MALQWRREAGAELILDHLDLWKKWSTLGGGPFGRKHVGKVDLNNIGLMGHSRGGEGVARATVPGVAMSVILPYCDGDVSPCGSEYAGRLSAKEQQAVGTANTRDSYDLNFCLVLPAPHEGLLAESFGHGVVIDDDPTPTLTIGPATATENAEFLEFPLKLSAQSDKFVWVSGQLADGTAVIRKDYTSMWDNGTDPVPDRSVDGYIEPGQTSGTIQVRLLDDKVKEPTETFTAVIDHAEGGTIKLPVTVTGTIRDND